ncbi:MAG TPA: nucleotidyltransferase domain-containing protein [Bryobacteraceae bacterium]|nr:nucleotidyltransferase domain-containing protein [Bryobacteraceae bacterium]
MEKVLDQLVEKLRKAYGDRLVSVVLYGSAAAGDRHAQFSDFNILCVLTEISTRELGESEAIFRWWREKGSPAPLLLSEHEVVTSTDSFAVEFIDMKQSHQVLYGKDVISSLVVDRSFHRAQVEHELRAKLLRLRQKASGMLSNEDLLRRLLLESLSTFCVLFRHALLLQGDGAPSRKREVIARAKEVFGINPLPFDKLLDIREERLKPRELEPVALLDSYLQGIAVVIDAVDRLEK